MSQRACDACHRRKVQCYGSPPPCTRCKHNNIACTYDRLKRVSSRGPVASSNSGGLLRNRIERIEHALSIAQRDEPKPINADQNSPPGLLTPSHGARKPPSLPFHFAGHLMGHVGSFTGIPVVSATGKAWIEERIGIVGCADKLCGISVEWVASIDILRANESTQQVPGRTVEAAMGLPARRAVEHLFALYRSTGFSKIFCLCDPVLFKRTLNMAYGSPANLGAQAQVFAFMLMTAECQHEWNSSPRMDEKGYESQLVPLIPHLIGEPDVLSAQTFLMMAIYYLFRGNQDLGLLYQNIACRHLIVLDAHIDPVHLVGKVRSEEDEVSIRIRRHLRRLFWVGYWSDGELSLRTGRQPSFDDDYCDLTLPSENEGTEASLMNVDFNLGPTPANITQSFSSDDLKLSMVKAHVGKGLYSSSALRKSDAEILCTVRELDDELEHWRVSVPEADRPSLGIDYQWLPHDDQNLDGHVKVRRIAMRLRYLHLMTIIHQASSRCQTLPTLENGADQLWGISSSMAISLHASREMLSHVKLASGVLSAMRGVLFYPVTAALNIFCNILLDPLGPRAAEDLQVILLAADLSKNLTSAVAAERGELRLPYLEQFIAELVRLGQCSMDLAKMRSASEQVV